ncbi:condensin [Pseudozyma hubeiensis SY62]|uniref:Condensin n=1 Tax=Pseudozyma hubeiensis (strain SY62) TaxID=1305764 RepID=R9NWZ5_PSEHS|nr:condensin [Pseudozyma hubeiensis SY62]GAC93066.1 condensin [Pseudozyma hubeiensis SY62]
MRSGDEASQIVGKEEDDVDDRVKGCCSVRESERGCSAQTSVIRPKAEVRSKQDRRDASGRVERVEPGSNAECRCGL